MLSASDLVRIPYTPDLSEGGIAYACRSLAYTYDRMGGSPVERMRRIAAGVAVELAFRRHLGRQGVPFDVLGATPFTDPDHYDLSLGGHRCDLKSYHITRREQIDLLRRDPSAALPAPALVPLDQFAAEGHRADDLYLFAFLLGEMTARSEEVDRLIAAGKPACLVHPLPADWARPHPWVPLAPLAMKSECDSLVALELGGQDAERNFITQRVELSPRQRILIPGDWHSLAYMKCAHRPGRRIGLHSPVHAETYLIPSIDWGNVWIDGEAVLLLGWLTHEQFRRRSRLLNAGVRTFQYARTRTKNLAVPLAELEPLGPLFERLAASA
jgi:hypothetical protein